MSQHFVELRSDTFTKPTSGMLTAMMEAEVGDDMYGEDPTVAKLEATVARITGKEAALFVPSGTMGNQLGIHLNTRHGDSVICEEESHVMLYEAGAGAVLSGIQYDTIPWVDEFSDAAIDARFKKEDVHYSTSSLLLVENTHNRGAGRVFTSAELDRICKKAKSLGLQTHCDGARIWNAAVALETDEQTLLRGFDTTSVCFSKGLGAPVGSALCGPKALIERARKVRKRWGGAMRQAGYLAAGALYALEYHRSLLKRDHANAETIAMHLREVLSSGRGFVEYPDPGTNILYFGAHGVDGDMLAKRFLAEGIRLSHLGHGKLRMVTHLDVSDADIESTMQAITKIFEG